PPRRSWRAIRSSRSSSSPSAVEQSRARWRSVFRQIRLELPRAHLGDVVAPLLALRLDEVRRDVLAEGAGDHVVLLQLVERLVEIVRQIVDPQPALLAEAHLPDVLVHR